MFVCFCLSGADELMCPKLFLFNVVVSVIEIVNLR